MLTKQRRRRRTAVWLLAGLCAVTVGCHSSDPASPRALRQQQALFDSGRGVVARPPTEPMDVMPAAVNTTVLAPRTSVQWSLEAANNQPGSTLSGNDVIGPDGTLVLGPYGSFQVAGLTPNQAAVALEAQLRSYLKQPKVRLRVLGAADVPASAAAVQWSSDPIDGPVPVSAWRVPQDNGAVIPAIVFPSNSAALPSVPQPAYSPNVDAAPLPGNSSAVYYVVLDVGSAAPRMLRLPFTGTETVFDAVNSAEGSGTLPETTARKRVWLVRRATPDGKERSLAVDWAGITQRGASATNYPLMPGDRIYVQPEHRRTLHTVVDSITSPFQRFFHGSRRTNEGAVNEEELR